MSLNTNAKDFLEFLDKNEVVIDLKANKSNNIKSCKFYNYSIGGKKNIYIHLNCETYFNAPKTEGSRHRFSFYENLTFMQKITKKEDGKIITEMIEMPFWEMIVKLENKVVEAIEKQLPQSISKVEKVGFIQHKTKNEEEDEIELDVKKCWVMFKDRLECKEKVWSVDKSRICCKVVYLIDKSLPKEEISKKKEFPTYEELKEFCGRNKIKITCSVSLRQITYSKSLFFGFEVSNNSTMFIEKIPNSNAKSDEETLNDILSDGVKAEEDEEFN